MQDDIMREELIIVSLEVEGDILILPFCRLSLYLEAVDSGEDPNSELMKFPENLNVVMSYPQLSLNSRSVSIRETRRLIYLIDLNRREEFPYRFEILLHQIPLCNTLRKHWIKESNHLRILNQTCTNINTKDTIEKFLKIEKILYLLIRRLE